MTATGYQGAGHYASGLLNAGPSGEYSAHHQAPRRPWSQFAKRAGAHLHLSRVTENKQPMVISTTVGRRYM